jgi:hypothetical protein
MSTWSCKVKIKVAEHMLLSEEYQRCGFLFRLIPMNLFGSIYCKFKIIATNTKDIFIRYMGHL